MVRDSKLLFDQRNEPYMASFSTTLTCIGIVTFFFFYLFWVSYHYSFVKAQTAIKENVPDLTHLLSPIGGDPAQLLLYMRNSPLEKDFG